MTGFWLARALLTVTLLALMVPHAVQADSRSAVLERTAARVAGASWSVHSFAVQAGRSYLVQLWPGEADADLYLFLDGREVARSTNDGLREDSIVWRARASGRAAAWVQGYGGDSGYEIAVDEIESGPPKLVALQVGHWRNWEMPAPFNGQSGSAGGGKTEPEVNLVIANRAAEILRAQGYRVEILPARIPQGYRADVFVALHSDGGPSARRGFFTDRFARSRMAGVEDRLKALIDEEYRAATGIPYVYRGTEGTRYYYGYYAVHPETPMVILEGGFLTNAADREVILGQPDRPAQAVARAIGRFLR